MSVLSKYVPRRPLTVETLSHIEGRLRDVLRGRVEEAYLFGSASTGSFEPASDIDLILIKGSALPFAARGTEFLDLFAIYPALDILVYTPAEFDQLMNTPGPGLWQSVRESKRRLL